MSTAVDVSGVLPSPELFAAVVGQERAVSQLLGAAVAPVHAYLFVGPPGSGRRDAALAFAAAVLCHHGGDATCRDCRLAVAGQHPDVEEVRRVGPYITADQARAVVERAALAPVEGARKVLVLHDFHLVREVAGPMLLKTIEEPSESTVFVILAEDVPPELVTIASRCVRIDFGPVPDHVVAATLVAEGIEAATAEFAAVAAGGNLNRARLLARDDDLVTRREAWRRVPGRLDGTGSAVAATVGELTAYIDRAGAPLVARHVVEAAEMEELVARTGERGSGRSQMEDRHKRELRRHRTDELRSGLATLATAYRDAALVPGSRARSAVEAVGLIHEALEALERNPNEALLLQALFLRLPPL